MAVLTGSYLHLSPYRRHLLLLHLDTRQVRLLGDPGELLPPDSGWHGSHDWYPGCLVFSIRDLLFDGDESPPIGILDFSLHLFSAERGVRRYSGHVTNWRGTSAPICEVVFNRQVDPPETFLPLLEHGDDWDDSIGNSSSDTEAVTAVPSGPPSSRDSLIAWSAPALASPRWPEWSDVDS